MRRGMICFVIGLCSAGTTADAAPAETVRVGSKNFTEQQILGELVAQLIERHTDLEVERKFGLGGTGICHAALASGELDIYVEYTGTALLNVLNRPPVTDRDEGFILLSEAYRQRFDLEWLPPIGFNNAYAITVRPDQAEENDWSRISDLAGAAGRLRAGFTGTRACAEPTESPSKTPATWIRGSCTRR